LPLARAQTSFASSTSSQRSHSIEVVCEMREAAA
jgi:hypothetical protein